MINTPVLQLLEPIRGLSSQRLDDLAVHCALETHEIGSDIFAEAGGPSNRLRYLIDGEMRVVFDDGASILLVGGCDIANWPIGYRTMQPVRSKAITRVSILSIDFDVLDLMMTWDGVTAEQSEETAARPAEGAMPSVALIDAKRFSWLPAAIIPEFVKQLERVAFKRDDFIIREGEKGDYFYIIESGRCIVSRTVGGVQLQLAELKAGDCFGEAALLTGEPRNANVKMVTEGVLLRMAQSQFENMMRRPLLHDMSWEAACEMVHSGGRWLDVRYPAEFFEDGLNQALNIPLNEIRTAFDLLDRNVNYVVYCQSGRRSSAAAFLLSQQGFHAYCLSGGLASIASEARTLEQGPRHE